MKTVIEVIKSLPDPYRQEVLVRRNPFYDKQHCSWGISNLLMLIMPPSAIRDTIIKAYLRGDLNPKAEARAEMVMPELSSSGASVWDIEIALGVHYENASYTDSDKFEEQYAE